MGDGKNKKRIPVIIDTDIGDDVDDAAALCLAMRCPEIALLGVTTVFRNTRARASIAKRLLRLGGMGDVPVAAGMGVPLNPARMFGRDVDYGGLPCTYRDEYYEEIEEAVTARELLARLLEESAEPVTLVTLGALTNVADLLRGRPDLKDRIKELRVMGGAYFINWIEYNFACDPEAAEAVLESGLTIKAVGIDVTLGCALSRGQMEILSNHPHPCIRMLMEMCRRWTPEGCMILHDPLALWSAFGEDMLEYERQVYRIETGTGCARGVCVRLSDHNWKVPAEAAALYVAKKVKEEEFVRACVDRLASYGR